MVVFSIKVSNSNPATIVIGRRGTYNTQEVTFDLSYLVENYGNGTAVLMLKRSQDISAYPAVASQADNVLTWTVSDADTYYVGNGEAQLMWYVNDGLAKTIIYPMVVMRDIIGTTEDPPSGYENWIEQLVDLGEETLENAQAAEQSATNAANSAVEADNSATGAETSATTAEAAKDAAELYKNGAETAKTAAETAQSNAEIAQGKAEDAQASAEDSADRAEAALAEFTTPTASATTLSPDASATASYANGHFTFGIPKGNKGDPGDPGVTPDFSIGTVETLQPTQPATASVTGTPEHPVLNLGIPKGAQGDPATNLVQSVNGKTGAVVLDSGDIAYESTTVEGELGTINSALTSLSAVTEIIDTASGAIASFPDGSGLPMRSLVAQINPVQDLHGQSSPYPAGGGKNIYPYETIPEYTYGWYSDYTFDGTPNKVLIKANTDYILSFQNSSSQYVNVRVFDTSKNLITDASVFVAEQGTDLFLPYNSTTHSFRLSGLVTYNWMKIRSSVDAYINLVMGQNQSASTSVQLELGTTATAWSPYSNICPISGWTGLTGQRTGFNVWDETWEIGDIDANTGQNKNSNLRLRSKGYIPIKPSTEYYMAVDVSQTISWYTIFYYDQSKTFIAAVSPYVNRSFTTPSGVCYMRFIFSDNWGGATYEGGISINYPSTDTTYHAYTGEAISVSFGTTVYGGSDEIISGNGISTMGMVDLGTLTWARTNTSGEHWRFYSYLNTMKDAGVMICSQYKQIGASAQYLGEQGISQQMGGQNLLIMVSDERYSDAATFKTAMSGVQLCYELATPTTFTHEGQEVDTLLGQNNVWVDTGDVSVTYQASIKGYIDKVLGQ